MITIEHVDYHGIRYHIIEVVEIIILVILVIKVLAIEVAPFFF